MKRMIVIDGNSVMFRAYFATAYSGNLMQARSGLYTNAIYGFANMMQHVLKNFEFDNIFVAFDKGKKTVRHQAYADYKGGRNKTPEEFLMQIPYIKEYLDVLGIKHLELDDYEADDIVGSMASMASPTFDEVMVISGDKDLLQLAHGNIHVYLTKKGLTDLEMYSEENFSSLMGFESIYMTDYKGLIGDNSDNLPGIEGVGPKTAAKLINEYGSLENIIAHGSEISGKLGERVRNGSETALRTKSLATLYTNLDLEYSVDDTVFVEPSKKALKEFYEKVEFTSFIKKLGDINEEVKTEENIVKIDDIEINYHYNETSKLVELLKNNKLVYMDLELTGENYHKEELLGCGFVIGTEGFFISVENFSDELVDLLNSDDLVVYAVDSKKLYASLLYKNIELKNIGFDLILGAYIVNPTLGNSEIKTIYDKFLENKLPVVETIYGKKSRYEIPLLDSYGTYCMDKASLLGNVKKVIDSELKKNDCMNLLYDIEIPLSLVLSEMEINGFKVDPKRLNEIGEYLVNEIKRLESEIYELSGEVFNIASPKQLGEILFEKLQITKGKKNKTGYSTSADVLEKLAPLHPVPKKVLEYRKYSKLYSTYVIGLLGEISSRDGKVHTLFKQALTLTGRLSSTEPNIQNIPVRTEDGRLIRSAFISSFEGGKLISADYSQIELRILSHMADCKNMINSFNSGEDLHAATASKIFGVEVSEVTKEQRRMAKAVNFGIVYGMSAWGLSEEVHCSPVEANNFIFKYFNIYPEIKDYLDKVVNDAKENGYTSTIYNRRRYMPEINSSNRALREFAERTAKNAPVQGTAADIIKIAMVNIQRKIKESGLKSLLISQVHDELVVDCYPGEEEVIKKLLIETMENVVSLKVQLKAELSEGYNWDMK